MNKFCNIKHLISFVILLISLNCFSQNGYSRIKLHIVDFVDSECWDCSNNYIYFEIDGKIYSGKCFQNVYISCFFEQPDSISPTESYTAIKLRWKIEKTKRSKTSMFQIDPNKKLNFTTFSFECKYRVVIIDDSVSNILNNMSFRDEPLKEQLNPCECVLIDEINWRSFKKEKYPSFILTQLKFKYK